MPEPPEEPPDGLAADCDGLWVVGLPVGSSVGVGSVGSSVGSVGVGSVGSSVGGRVWVGRPVGVVGRPVGSVGAVVGSVGAGPDSVGEPLVAGSLTEGDGVCA